MRLWLGSLKTGSGQPVLIETDQVRPRADCSDSLQLVLSKPVPSEAARDGLRRAPRPLSTFAAQSAPVAPARTPRTGTLQSRASATHCAVSCLQVSFDLDKELGKGAFGVVYQGQYLRDFDAAPETVSAR